MIAAGVIGRQQQEDEIDRLAVVGLEVDRIIQAREQAQDVAQAGELDVRDGDAAAEARRAEALALQQRVEDLAEVETGPLRRDRRQLL